MSCTLHAPEIRQCRFRSPVTDRQGRNMWTNRLRKTVLAAILFFITIGTSAFGQSGAYESQMADVNGVRLHYLKAGNGKNVLVLIHGFGDTSRMWIPLFNEFGKDFTIIAPDMRGLGESSRPSTGYDKKTLA